MQRTGYFRGPSEQIFSDVVVVLYEFVNKRETTANTGTRASWVPFTLRGDTSMLGQYNAKFNRVTQMEYELMNNLETNAASGTKACLEAMSAERHFHG